MKLSGQATLLRIFITETDKYQGQSLYEWIVRKAKELDIAGATVLRGIMGFGAHSHLHSAKLLRLFEDLPVIIEIVDTDEKLKPLLDILDRVVGEGLLTTEKVHVLRYQANKEDPSIREL